MKRGRKKGSGLIRKPKILSITLSTEQREYLNVVSMSCGMSAAAYIRRLVDAARCRADIRAEKKKAKEQAL